MQILQGVYPASEQMSDFAFWKELLAELNIGKHPFRGQQGDYRFSKKQSNRISRQIRKEGYFLSQPIIPRHEFEILARGISKLANARVLPVFIAVYDEFWQILYKLRHTFVPILGESYRLLPDFWVFHVAPNAASRGWKIHRDAELDRRFNSESLIREDWSPRMCTMWIPFTDADTHNSCIYVLPFPHDPAMQSFMRKESVAALQQQGTLTNLANVRALPARAGSVVGWTPYIRHWGSESTDWAIHPRISVGIYYHAADAIMKVAIPFDDEGRSYINLHDPDFRLDFKDRLAIIANIIAVYIRSGHLKSEPGFSPAVIEFCKRWRRKK